MTLLTGTNLMQVVRASNWNVFKFSQVSIFQSLAVQSAEVVNKRILSKDLRGKRIVRSASPGVIENKNVKSTYKSASLTPSLCAWKAIVSFVNKVYTFMEPSFEADHSF
jgi:hypothetical protein